MIFTEALKVKQSALRKINPVFFFTSVFKKKSVDRHLLCAYVGLMLLNIGLSYLISVEMSIYYTLLPSRVIYKPSYCQQLELCIFLSQVDII